MGDTFRYKAFISYSHADERWGTWLHRALERYRLPTYLANEHELPKKPLKPIFRDREELASSANLSQSIASALEASENLIVVCSPAAAQSRWVNEEIRAFRSLGRGARTFCLIVDGADVDCFPSALADQEPLAADIRQDSRQDAKLRLVSGLLNIEFGELKNREQRRRNRLLGASAAASLAIAGAMTALAVSAVAASNESERQRIIAEKAEADASAATDFLSGIIKSFDAKEIGYTIADDLRRQSARWGDQAVKPRDFVRNINRFTTARGVLEHHLFKPALEGAQTTLSEQPVAEARVLETIAAGYVAMDDCEKAVAVQASAVETYGEVAGGSDDRTLDARLELAAAHACAGEGDTAHAIRLDVLRARRAKGDNDLPTLHALHEAGWSYATHTGGVKFATGFLKPGPLRLDCGEGYCERYAKARALLGESVDGYRQLVGHEDARTLAAMADLASVQFYLGEHDEAERLLLDVLSLQRDSLGTEHPDTEKTVYDLGKFHLIMRDHEKAEDYFREQLRIANYRLGAGHPDTLDVLFDLADTFIIDGRRSDLETILAEAGPIVETTQPDDVVRELEELRKLATEEMHACHPDDSELLDCNQRVLRDKLLEVWDSI